MNKKYVIDELKKEASYRIVKTVAKALKQGLIGNKVKNIPAGELLKERLAAKKLYDEILAKEFKPIRARVAAPGGLADKLARDKRGIISDLLGIQVIRRKNPAKAVEELKNRIISLGGTIDEIGIKNKPGYKGINIKAVINGVPTELQVSPGYRANIGQILQHDAYKPPKGFTEFDKKIANALGGFLINNGIKNKKAWNDFFAMYAK